jgi:hypothetical protein
MSRYVEPISDWIKTQITFGICWIPEEDTRNSFGMQFVCSVRSEQGKTLTAKGFEMCKIKRCMEECFIKSVMI